MKHCCISLIILWLISLSVYAQDSVTFAGNENRKQISLKPYHRNVIKFNPTPMLIWTSLRNITFSYERVLNHNQSLVIQLGYLEFPALFKDTILHLVSISSHQKWGMNFLVEYRFYPGKRNRRPAPDGLYLGPYLSYYGFHFKNGLDVLNTNTDAHASLRGDFNIANLGLSLGYQFIFWKRISLDLLLFGPSLSMISADFRLDGDLDESKISDIDKEIINKLIERFPIIGTLFSGEVLRYTGYKLQLSPGFRYSIQFGFHF
ncbi:MAG: hypothetical protein WCP32_00285 [Bacteroidota bacterium]